MTIFGRDLFARAETLNKVTTEIPVTGITTGSQSAYGTARLTLRQTNIRPGSTVEGWIVRILSEGRVVRSDASLYELKTFAQKQSAEMDQIAEQALPRNSSAGYTGRVPRQPVEE